VADDIAVGIEETHGRHRGRPEVALPASFAEQVLHLEHRGFVVIGGGHERRHPRLCGRVLGERDGQDVERGVPGRDAPADAFE